MADTVQFDVSGRVFKVSRALIDAVPDSMLARMISETWEQEPGKPMFIDRDSDLFAQVLNYLRYGSIELPVTITQAMFQHELDYYGIPAVDGSVTQVKKKTPGQLAVEIGRQKMNNRIYDLAVECHNKFHQQGDSVTFELTKKEHHGYLSNEMIKQLNDYLDLFGLRVSVCPYPTSSLFTVSLNE
jgi:hypothetical protein